VYIIRFGREMKLVGNESAKKEEMESGM
jgi:hypothetical protein